MQVDDLRRELEVLAREAPDVDPRVLEAVEGRARRRRVGRRARMAVGAALAAIVLVGAVVLATGGRTDEPGIDVITSPPTTTTVPATVPERVALPSSVGLRVEPSSGVADGQRIEAHPADDPQGEFVARICPIEAVERNDAKACGQTYFYLQSPAGSPDRSFPVARVIRTSQGLVDCGESAGRCAVTTTPNAPRKAFATISFADGSPLAEPAISLSSESVDSGDAISISGSGFRPGDDVIVAQCPPGLDPMEAVGCDLARAVRLVADTDGTFSVLFIPYTERFTHEGWEPCAPCVVTAWSFRTPAVGAPVEVEGQLGSDRPTARIAEPGPYSPGQLVTVEGFNLQADTEVFVSTCTDGPCVFRDGSDTTVNSDGSFAIVDFPLPDGEADTMCQSIQSGCAIAYFPPTEGAPAAFRTPFTY